MNKALQRSCSSSEEDNLGDNSKEDFPLEGMAVGQNQRENMLPSCEFYSDKAEMCPNLIAGTCS